MHTGSEVVQPPATASFQNLPNTGVGRLNGVASICVTPM
jgi:hypothetical protein